MTRKMSQRYFSPAEYATKTKPETNQKLTPTLTLKCFLGLGLGFGLVLGFVLVVYSAGQKYRWLIFLVVSLLLLAPSYAWLVNVLNLNHEQRETKRVRKSNENIFN